MLTAGKGHWGLGLSIGGSTNDPYFSHGGVDAGFESLLVAYENHGDGAIVMTNAEGGTSVANEVMQSISAEYGWADFHPTARAAVQVDRAVLERYVGTYQLAPDFSVAIRLDGNQLQGQGTGQSVFKMFAESQKKFFLTDENAQIEFFADGKDDDKDKVAYMILYQGGQQMKGVKK
jgi:hypothetical protein